jgi:hypothetical protein
MVDNAIGKEESREELYGAVVRILSEQFSYDMTPAEAVDYLAVEKAGVATGKWADVREVAHSTVSGNVSGARDKINMNRLDAEMTDEDDQIVVSVTDHDDEKHELLFQKETSVMGRETTATLTLVYEAMSAVHGHYIGDDGTEFESTLWFDGRMTSSFEEFDFNGEWGSPEAKADTIFWSRDSDQ